MLIKLVEKFWTNKPIFVTIQNDWKKAKTVTFNISQLYIITMKIKEKILTRAIWIMKKENFWIGLRDYTPDYRDHVKIKVSLWYSSRFGIIF